MPLLLFLIPFVISLALFCWPRRYERWVSWVGTTGILLNLITLFILSITHNLPIDQHYTWLQFGDLSIRIGYRLDGLTALMLALVNLISLLVHLFSMVYMKVNEHRRYFAMLSLFVSTMIALLLSDNLLVTFVFWELVGFCSYLLIGFWSENPQASRASKKAFLVNRAGDVFFLIGIILYFIQFGSFDYPTLEMLGEGDHSVILLCLFGGTVAKSAQFPLHVWLPDAMSGPTPASALIHAATMVAAGIYLLSRVICLNTPISMMVIASIGAFTSLLGALIATQQDDLKKVLAYSTISQIGLMVMGMGVGAFEASMMHLFTHAFFKAGLFLSAGAIIHHLHQVSHHDFDAQDMRLMGGLRKRLPIVFVTYTICMLALVGFPLTSGFLSKDALLLQSLTWATVSSRETGRLFYFLIPSMAWLSVFLTAFYMGRQWIMVFWGESRSPVANNLSPQRFDWRLHLPLVVLAMGSIGFVFSSNPLDVELSWLFRRLSVAEMPRWFGAQSHKIDELTHHWHTGGAILSVALLLLGLGFAYYRYVFQGKIKSRERWTSLKRGFYLDQWYAQAGRLLGLAKYNPLLKTNNTYYLGTLPVLTLSKYLVVLEQKVIDAFVLILAKSQVVVAHIIAWFDHALVDGMVRGFYKFLARVGATFYGLQKGGVQKYLFVLLLICLGLVLGIYFLIYL